MADEKRLVWDLPLRLFHWLIVLGICASWLTAELEWMEIHFWCGYVMIALLAFRIVWGFIGPRHARFSTFFPGPASLWRYTKALATGKAVQSIGHNPLGSLMVVLMLALLGLQAGTGLFTTDDVIWSGPYNPAVSEKTAKLLTRLHHANFDWILMAVSVHILAIAFYAFIKKHNLVGPMFTGKKLAAVVPDHEAIASSQIVKAIVVILLAGAAVYWLINAAPPPADNFY
jgi:cytochrome b